MKSQKKTKKIKKSLTRVIYPSPSQEKKLRSSNYLMLVNCLNKTLYLFSVKTGSPKDVFKTYITFEKHLKDVSKTPVFIGLNNLSM